MVGASDLIVLAEVVAAAPGRTLTDPADPSTGVETELVELEVVEVLAPVAPEPLDIDYVVLEQEVALLDGTPIEVDGVDPVEVGRRGVFFLVVGGSEEAPHVVLVGPQGRFLVEDDALVPSADDDLSRRLADGGGPALRESVEAIAGEA